MFRLLRWFVYFILFLIVLIALAYGAAQIMRPKILETITRELQRNVNGEILVGDLDFTVFEQFPVLSITLSEIHVRGPLYSRFHREFYSIGKIYVHAHPYRVLRGEITLKSITIKDANIFIFRTAKGLTNLDIFIKRDTSAAQGEGTMMSLAIEKVLLEDSRITYFDSTKMKSYGAEFIRSTVQVGQSDTSRLISIRGPMKFAGLMFNETKGSYLRDKEADADLNIEFIPKYHRLVIAPSTLKFHESMVSTSGHFNFREPGTFELTVHSDALSYAEGLTIVTPVLAEKLGKYKFDRPIELTAKIAGVVIHESKPRVDVSFSTKGNHGVAGKIDISKLSFAGSFTNYVNPSLPYDDRNSRVEASNFSGVFQEIPFNASFIVTDLTNPEFNIVSRVNMNMRDLNREVDPAKIKFFGGALVALVEYKGKLRGDYIETLSSGEGVISGTIDIKNGSLEYVPKGKTFRHTEMQLRFNQSEVNIEKIATVVNGNEVDMRGTITGLFLSQPGKKGFVKLFVHSRRLDLATLVEKKTARKGKADKGNKRVSEFIDGLYAKALFEIDFKVDELINGPLRANGVVGKVRLSDNQLSVDPLSMKLAGGTVDIKARMTGLDKKVSPLGFWTRIRDAEIKKLFTSFGNFSQKGITDKHISGKVSATINMTARVDDRFKVQPRSLKGVVDVRIKNGRLKDYPPLQKMSNFLFKKRDFTDVQFAEIRSHFQMEGNSVNVQRMEVESSVLKLFLEGRYSLANDTDLSIQVPLSNLKKRNKDYKPENVGVDAKVGPSVFLRAHHKEGELVIAYDPLKKFKKK